MQHTAAAPRTLGDAAVDGLLSGAAAGVLMAVYLVVAGLAYGEGILTTIGRFDPATGQSPAVGALAHLAVASIYGSLFGLGSNYLDGRLRGTLARCVVGAIYGLGLYVVAAGVLLPAWGPFLQEVPTPHFTIAHLIFGAALGLLSGRAHAR